MINKLGELEELSRLLEPNAEVRTIVREKVIKHVDTFLEKLPHVAPFVSTDDMGIGIYDSPITDEPIDIKTALNLFEHNIENAGVNIGSGKYFAFLPGGGLYYSALGDYLAAATNRYAGSFYASSGAIHLEKLLIGWMRDFIGYPEQAEGDLTSGGSMANLSAILTAREAYNLKAQDVAKSVVYISQQSHFCIQKALHIIGFAQCIQRYIPVDSEYRMNPEALESAIKQDKQKGLQPWLVVATAGTTSTGAIDPLRQISEIAHAHQVWLHVDGAYGLPFALCETGKQLLDGIETSDSLVLDPHKALFLPLGTGAVLVREGKKLYQTFRRQADYMYEPSGEATEISPYKLSPELSRPFRGLRLWLPLKLIGVAPFRAALEEKLLLARYFYERLQQLRGFELGPPPQLSVVTFRYVPQRGNIETFNQILLTTIKKDGDIFISSTRLDGKFVLRLAILGFRVHKEQVELAINVLLDTAKRLEQEI